MRFAGPLLLSSLTPLLAQQIAFTAERCKQLIEAFAVPTEARAAAREFTGLGAAALPFVHRALHDSRPLVVQWTLYATASLRCDLESLRDPIRALAKNKDPGIAIAAQQAWPAIDGKGRVLLADYQANQVLAFEGDESTTLFADLRMVMSAVPLLGGGHLVTVYGTNQVIEFDAKGEEVWAFGKTHEPSDAERLPNGHTLIADSGNQRVIEVDRAGDVVWSYEEKILPIDADRLANGNTLIANYNAGGAIEVDPSGKVVWQFPGDNIRDADRLLDGTTLLTLTDQKRVLLVDMAKQPLREWKFDFEPNDSELLADGHLVAAGRGTVVEIDANGEELWRCKISFAGRVLRLGARAEARPEPRSGK